MAHITGQGNYTSKLNPALGAPPAGIAEFFSALNIFLSIAATVGNALILIALKNVSSIHPPTKLFFQCLAVTDLCVGLIVHPLSATIMILLTINMNVNVLNYLFKIWGALTVTLCGLSVASSTAISVDRLLALSLGLRYRHVVTLRRSCFVIICVWLVAPPFGWLWVKRIDIAFKAATVGATLCLVTSIFCYARIHLKLRPQQAQVQSNVPHGQGHAEGIPRNIARYKRTVSSIMWVQLALVACYLPWVIAAVLEANGVQHDVASYAVITLVYLNSSLNPILYCWKIREVKQAVKEIIRQFSSFQTA